MRMKAPLTGRPISELTRDYLEATRLADELGLDAARRARLAAYRRFVEKQQHRLGPFPAALLPVAHAEPLDSRVRQDAPARETARPPSRPWLRRLHCPDTDGNPALLATIDIGAPVDTAAVFEADGRPHAVTGSFDGRLRVCDLTTYQQFREFRGHDNRVNALA